MESSPLTFFDEIWQKALDSSDGQEDTETIGQAATSDIIRAQVEEKSIRLGKLLALLPISKYGQIAPPFWLSIDVAAFLAVIDFNRRASAISDSISELTKDCDLFLTLDFRDPQFNAIISGRECQEAFLYSKEQNTEKRPMAVVGPVRSEVSAVVAALGGAATRRETPDVSSRFVGSEGIPNISPASRSSQLENTEVRKNVVLYACVTVSAVLILLVCSTEIAIPTLWTAHPHKFWRRDRPLSVPSEHKRSPTRCPSRK
jgi:hypothetical protein